VDSRAISSTGRLGGVQAGSEGSGKLRRRTLLAAIVGLLVSPSIPALADTSGQYGRGYRGGYR
jgi:hypothetical protein